MAKRRNRKRKTSKAVVKWHDPKVGNMALWIMTPFGILMPSKRPAELVKDGDTRTLQVRARRREYLDKFRDTFCPNLGANEHHPDQDYPWKAPVSPEDLALAVSRMVFETDSEKFKPLAEESKYALPGKLGQDLHDAYNSMWSTQLRLSDGTSSYDKKWSSKTPGYGTSVKGIYACKLWGHWWRKGIKTCTDCGAPNPKYPEAGPVGVKPTDEEFEAWKQDHPNAPKPYEQPALPMQEPASYEAWDDPEECGKLGHKFEGEPDRKACTFCGITESEYLDELAELDGGDPEAVGDCSVWGHYWPKDTSRCTYCGADRPGNVPFDLNVATDKRGDYWIAGQKFSKNQVSRNMKVTPLVKAEAGTKEVKSLAACKQCGGGGFYPPGTASVCPVCTGSGYDPVAGTIRDIKSQQALTQDDIENRLAAIKAQSGVQQGKDVPRQGDAGEGTETGAEGVPATADAE